MLGIIILTADSGTGGGGGDGLGERVARSRAMSPMEGVVDGEQEVVDVSCDFGDVAVVSCARRASTTAKNMGIKSMTSNGFVTTCDIPASRHSS